MARKKKFEDYIRNYGNMSAKRKVRILWDAIEYMQQYNGRTVYECIVLAMAANDGVDGMDLINDKILRGEQ